MNLIPMAIGRFLVYWDPTSKISDSLILINMTTNKNKTVIAPIYNIIYEIPIKPIPNKIKYPAALTNTDIKKITAITGFLDVITRTLERRDPKASKSIKIFFMFKI